MLTPKSVLPESLHAKLGDLGAKLEQQIALGREFDGILDEMSDLKASTIVRADSEIAYSANLQKWRRQYPLVVRLFSPKTVDIDQLGRVPKLEYLFLFHRDGYIREAALNRIESAIPSPFLFAAIAWRLNDWVLPVRKAAAQCALRCFPVTSPDVVAEAAIALLARENSWGRWSEERSALAEAFARPDVAEHLAQLIRASRTGPMATVLRYALREGSLDGHLERLACEAIQPAVRATAVQAIIDGYATWSSGWTWRWVNKPRGIRRRETTYSKRVLEQPADRACLIEASARDRSAIVRRVAASSIIQHELAPDAAHKMAVVMMTDKSPSVRERAEFFLKRAAS